MRIIEASTRDVDTILNISSELPQWFTQSGLDSIKKGCLFQNGYLIEVNQSPVGFLLFFVNQGEATISWMGVRKAYHGNGCGKALINRLEHDLKSSGIVKIYVSTLGDKVKYEPYNLTRSFYRNLGFEDFKRIEHKDNPECEEELILRKII